MPAALPTLSAAEQALLQQVQDDNAEARRTPGVACRLLHALDSSGVSTGQLDDELEDGARLLLARIAITVADINAIVVNPQ